MSPFTIIIRKAGMVTFFVTITLSFTQSRSNSLLLTCDDLDRMILTYANFQDHDNDLNSSSIRLLTI